MNIFYCVPSSVRHETLTASSPYPYVSVYVQAGLTVTDIYTALSHELDQGGVQQGSAYNAQPEDVAAMRAALDDCPEYLFAHLLASVTNVEPNHLAYFAFVPLAKEPTL